MGHVLMENRNGLAIDATLTHATGRAEREATLTMLDRRAARRRITLGADTRVAHQHIQQVMREVRHCDPHDVLFDVHFHDLMDAVLQHMEEAEHTMVPHAAAPYGER